MLGSKRYNDSKEFSFGKIGQKKWLGNTDQVNCSVGVQIGWNVRAIVLSGQIAAELNLILQVLIVPIDQPSEYRTKIYSG